MGLFFPQSTVHDREAKVGSDVLLLVSRESRMVGFNTLESTLL